MPTNQQLQAQAEVLPLLMRKAELLELPQVAAALQLVQALLQPAAPRMTETASQPVAMLWLLYSPFFLLCSIDFEKNSRKVRGGNNRGSRSLKNVDTIETAIRIEQMLVHFRKF
jgi:hypothetical protein